MLAVLVVGLLVSGNELRAQAIRAARSAIAPLSIDEICQVPGRKEFVLLAGKKKENDRGVFYADPQLFYLRYQSKIDGFRLDSKSLVLPTDGEPGKIKEGDFVQGGGSVSSSLRVMTLDRKRTLLAAVVERDCGPADCHPSLIHIVLLSHHGFGKRKCFTSLIDDTRVVPAGQVHGLRVFVAPIFKAWGPDVYEWDGHRFRFANQRSADLYLDRGSIRSPQINDGFLTTWMNWAVMLDVRGMFNTALHFWRGAARICRILAAHGRGVRGKIDYEYAGFYGEPGVCLQEIRERIRWIKNGRTNPMLLYRPFDFGLQVPPYRLGPARGSQDG